MKPLSLRCVTRGGLSAANKYLSGNGVQLTYLSGGNSDLLNLPANPSLDLGRSSHLGYILEFIFYDKALEETDEDAIEAYLRAKWQKGVDGISTTELAAHYDAMKAETTTTDVCSTAYSSTQTDNDGDSVGKTCSKILVMRQATSGSSPLSLHQIAIWVESGPCIFKVNTCRDRPLRRDSKR